jgi:hypothetical protein
VKTLTEAIRSSNRSSVITKGRVIQQFDRGYMLSSSCDISLQDDSPLATIPPLLSEPPMMVPPLPEPPMEAPPVPEPPLMAPSTPPSWTVHLPSYPPRVICKFCFNDSHEVKNFKQKSVGTAGKNLTRTKRYGREMKKSLRIQLLFI